MDGSWFFDKNFNGVPDDFFEDAMKYFDFPMEDVKLHKEEEEEDWEAQFQHIEPPPSNVLKGFSSGVRSDDSNGNSNMKNSLSITPSTGEASSRSLPLHYDSLEGNYLHHFRTSSPVSVLESSSSSSSCSGGNPTSNHPRFVVPVKRPRSKRRLQRRACPYIFSSSAFKRFCPLFALESESESQKISNPAKKKKKERNLTQLSCTLEINKPSVQQPVETRKCAHCGVTKTPQWREGPTGPKTLCNACGVRYRSGRLLPEYRPAASPTFVPSLHSNCHRKVLEMRKKDTQVISTAAAPEY